MQPGVRTRIRVGRTARTRQCDDMNCALAHHRSYSSVDNQIRAKFRTFDDVSRGSMLFLLMGWFLVRTSVSVRGGCSRWGFLSRPSVVSFSAFGSWRFLGRHNYSHNLKPMGNLFIRSFGLIDLKTISSGVFGNHYFVGEYGPNHVNACVKSSHLYRNIQFY